MEEETQVLSNCLNGEVAKADLKAVKSRKQALRDQRDIINLAETLKQEASLTREVGRFKTHLEQMREMRPYMHEQEDGLEAGSGKCVDWEDYGSCYALNGDKYQVRLCFSRVILFDI